MAAPLRHTMLAVTLENHLDGKRYEKVPEHITVLPWIDLTGKRGDFLRAAQVVCAAARPMTLTLGDTVVVGPADSEKQARLVRGRGLYELHQKLFSVITELGIEIANPEWFGDDYLPHTTADHTPDVLAAQHLAVIDNIPSENGVRGMKLITQKLLLGRVA